MDDGFPVWYKTSDAELAELSGELPYSRVKGILGLHDARDNYQRALDREIMAIRELLIAEDLIPRSVLNWLFSIGKRNTRIDVSRFQDSSGRAMGLWQTLLHCLPELRCLTLSRPIPLVLAISETSFQEAPANFCPKLTNITADRNLWIKDRGADHNLWAIDHAGYWDPWTENGGTDRNLWIKEPGIYFHARKLPDHLTYIPITALPTVRKFRSLAMNTTVLYETPAPSYVCRKTISHGLTDLHLNQVRWDLADARKVLSGEPNISTLHLQRFSTMHGTGKAGDEILPSHMHIYRSQPRGWTLPDLLQWACEGTSNLTTLTINFHLVASKEWEVMFGRDRCIQSLAFLGSLRHLSISSSAILGPPRDRGESEESVADTFKYPDIKLDEFFPESLRTLTIIESEMRFHEDLQQWIGVEWNRHPQPQPDGGSQRRRADVMGRLLMDLADAIGKMRVGLQRKRAVRSNIVAGGSDGDVGEVRKMPGGIEEVVFAGPMDKEIRELTGGRWHFGNEQLASNNPEGIMGKQLEKIRDAFVNIGVDFRVEEEFSLGMEPDL